MNDKKKLILNLVNDLISDLLYYDRKESESIKIGEIENEIVIGNVTIDEMVDKFREALTQPVY